MMKPLTASDMRNSFARAAPALRRYRGHAADIIHEVARERDVSVEEILAPTRGVENVAHARQVAYRRVRERLGYSYTRIGHIFRRDHATVIYGIRAAVKRGDG